MATIPQKQLSLLVLALFSLGCQRLVVNTVAGSLSGEGLAYAADDDPELVREAVPFGLKTLESLLESSPENDKLLLSAASGFTQYGYAFVLQDAQMQEDTHPELVREQYQRAKKLFKRAWQYGFRGLEARHKGFADSIRSDRARAMREMKKTDVPLLYWSGAALAAQISISKDDMTMVGRLPEVEALMARALELDEAYDDGAIHEFFVAYDSRSPSMGGSLDRAREHFDRVMVITGESKMAPLVTWAESVAVQQQDKKRFLELLDQVLAFDVDKQPRYRLVNLIAQRRARWLKSRVSDLFVE